jgi:type 1 fimbria pilin
MCAREFAAMSIRDAFIVSLLGIVGYTSAAACANSCANVDVIGSFDRSGLTESEFGIYAAGTFRIAGEADENKQPNFNLSTINCEKQFEDVGKASLECKVMQGFMWATSDKPDTDKPNCSLDLNFSTFSMKELQKGILTGIETSTGCYNTLLTIDRNTKRVYMSFTRTKDADNYDKISPGICGISRPTHVLMNCTGWPRIRKQGRTPPRCCDFSSSSDK